MGFFPILLSSSVNPTLNKTEGASLLEEEEDDDEVGGESDMMVVVKEEDGICFVVGCFVIKRTIKKAVGCSD